MVRQKTKNKNEILRNEIKELKLQEGVSYKEFVEIINYNYSTFYSWLRGSFNYSEEKLEDIENLINSIKEGNF